MLLRENGSKASLGSCDTVAHAAIREIIIAPYSYAAPTQPARSLQTPAEIGAWPSDVVRVSYDESTVCRNRLSFSAVSEFGGPLVGSYLGSSASTT
jgi:hypothetical protein